MKNKKSLIIIITAFLIVVSLIGSYSIFFKEDKNTTLTLIERQWIESNKSQVVDLSILNNVPILTNSGDGVFFDFLKDLQDDTNLEFNNIAYLEGTDVKSAYSLKKVNELGDKQLLIYQDNYVVLTNSNTKYNSLKEMPAMTVGVLAPNMEAVNNYLNVDSKLLLKSYDNANTMISDLTAETPVVNAIVLPKIASLENIISNGNINIAYNITEMNDNYVFQLGDTEKLNDIIIKYYKKWYKESYTTSYQKHFSNDYFKYAKIDDKQKVEFKSKRYIYGFVENRPYDDVISGNLVGINHIFMRELSDFANIEISYKKYNSIDKMIKDFNENKIDVFFNNTTYFAFDMDVQNMVSTSDEEVVILNNPSNILNINSSSSLKGKDVMVISSSRIADYLANKGVNVIGYDNLESLLAKMNKDSIIAIDRENYNYYSDKLLADFRVSYSFNLPTDYNFTVRSISENEVFANFLNFYLSYIPEKSNISKGYHEIINLRESLFSTKTLLLIIFIPIIIVLLVFGFIKLKKGNNQKKKRVNKISKEDKLKYIDMLTSLKNRTYLNDNVERWDNSEVYPQTIIIIDLNNVAYINDNYGHAEGDKVIGEAANILITTQMPNTDIIRTNGNEFLIYMVEYEEKQVISYMRKLNKDFKSLSHGFGAAMGYSIISDAIKTVDDAINEATLDMRNNKEEIDY